ncbi:ribosome small subunit-dependent GTPase A [Aureimonas sp. AU12]|uniref:ribosome small subunit-dependent GTPase A n=1 Tax=Aureimonas sp. AU12 TaxID=1638161 RepID=UPI000780C05E|nr:ribosome small subunit-dependent GTPase A [Aureimonas sp. AU12]
MIERTEPDARRLLDLGWSGFFEEQVAEDEAQARPARITSVHRTRMGALTLDGPVEPVLPHHARTSEFAVGDFVLLEPGTDRLLRRLERRSVVERRVTGSRVPQLAGANIDTLFIATSCNADFNVARLERYLALANQSRATPVMLLTKGDLADDPASFETQARALQRDLVVVMLNPKSPDAAGRLAPWCGPGQTVALIGSSGVGKSTLVNTLAGAPEDGLQQTGSIRENDAKGRHTTTARSLHPMVGGGWVLDTPGMRSVQVSDVGEGLDTLFAEITELAPLCRFRDCTHAHEPGCAVQAAVKAGTVDPSRVERWRKLRDENTANAEPETKWGTGAPGGQRRRR